MGLPTGMRILRVFMFSMFMIMLVLTLVYMLYQWVDISADTDGPRRTELFARAIMILSVVIIDILMVMASFGLLINSPYLLEAYAAISILFLSFNLFNARNFRWTGWVAVGLTVGLCFLSFLYGQLLRHHLHREKDRRRHLAMGARI
ncbi:hypothetical protein HDE_04800 [Halotydeus destructor]|nr:hypothetical protein HDE_04800 [Halotydeus destructor]